MMLAVEVRYRFGRNEREISVLGHFERRVPVSVSRFVRGICPGIFKRESMKISMIPGQVLDKSRYHVSVFSSRAPAYAGSK
jgi:hypothetical protein